MVLEERSVIVIGDNELLAELRSFHKIFPTIRVVKKDYKKMVIKTSFEDRKRVHFYEFLLTGSIEVLHEYFESLKNHKYFFFNQYSNLIS